MSILNRLSVRLYLAALALLGIFAVAKALEGRAIPTELAQPRQRLEELPKTFGEWKGEKSPQDLDPRIFKAIGAKMATNRLYRERHGVVSLHCAVFLEYGVRTLHPPELCYQGIGYTVAESQTVSIGVGAGHTRAVRFLALEHGGQREYCLYWYQIGDTTFWDGDGQRRAVLALRGREVRPPLIKVMLATTARSPEEAAASLKDLAESVYPWTRDFH
jgi:EpsI family protein